MTDTTQARLHLADWLGDTEVTDDQLARLLTAWLAIEDRYPIPTDGTEADVADDRERALSAATQVILDDADAADLAADWQQAQARAITAHAALTGALIAAAQTESQRSLAERVGLSRASVAKALGR